MRTLAFDFDFTILAPLIVFLLITLWNSIQAYRWPTEELHERRPFLEQTKEYADWEWERQEEKRKAKTLIWVSAIGLVLVCGAWPISDKWKVFLAHQAWSGLQIISILAFFFATWMAWGYARRQKRLQLIVCLLAMLVTAASSEHFSHQTINTGRIVCPHCGNDDQPDDDQ
jgi:hypothetical protein